MTLPTARLDSPEELVRILRMHFGSEAGRPKVSFAEAVVIAGERGFKVREQPAEPLFPDHGLPARIGFAFLPGSDKATGRLVILALIQNAIALEHTHGDGGEVYWTLCGTLFDVADNGSPIAHRLEDPPVRHGPKTTHAPRASGLWIGVYDQPTGSDLTPAGKKRLAELVAAPSPAFKEVEPLPPGSFSAPVPKRLRDRDMK